MFDFSRARVWGALVLITSSDATVGTQGVHVRQEAACAACSKGKVARWLQYRAAGRSGAAGRSLWFYTKNGSFSPISQTFSNSSRAFIIIDVPHRVRSSADDLGRSFYHNQFEKLLRTAPLGLSTTSDFTHGHTDIQNHHSAYDSRRTAWVWPQTASRKFSVPQKVISRTRLLRPIFLGSASRIFNHYTLCKRRT